MKKIFIGPLAKSQVTIQVVENRMRYARTGTYSLLSASSVGQRVREADVQQEEGA